MDQNSEAAPEPTANSKFWRSPVGKLSLLAICMYVVLVSTPLIPIPLSYGLRLLLAASLLATLVLAGLSVGLIVQGARLQVSAVQELGLLVVSAGLWFGLARLATLSHLHRLLVTPLATVMFLLVCLWLGRVISRLFRDRSILLPVCAAAAVVDIFTVYAGPTGIMLEKHPEFVESLAMAIPQIGSAVGGEGLAGLSVANFIGLGDFIFLAAFLAAGARFGFDLARTAGVVLLLVAVGMTVHIVSPIAIGIPLLPFIATGFVVANWREFRLSAEERKAVAAGVLLIAALVLVMWLLFGRT